MKVVSERRTWTKAFPGDDDVPLGRQKSIEEVGGELYRITETIQREGVFAVVPSACSVCDKKSDAMNDSIAAYLSEHGSTGRLNFAGTAQRAENDTDVFPIEGWDTHDGSMWCPDCLQELAAIIERLTVERDDALAMNRTMLQERTASHDTEYGHVMAKRCAEEFNESR